MDRGAPDPPDAPRASVLSLFQLSAALMMG